MTKRFRIPVSPRTMRRQLAAMKRLAKAASTRWPASPSSWLTSATERLVRLRDANVALGPAGARRFRLYRPPNIKPDECLPLLVMLHRCGQDADGFAASTRMNDHARRECFAALSPEQHRQVHGQGCWNAYGIGNGRIAIEGASIMQAIDRGCRLHPVDGTGVAIAGLSAGACRATLLTERRPDRFKALVMHVGIAVGTGRCGLSALASMRGQPPTPARATTPRASAVAWPPLRVIHDDADAAVSPADGRSAVRVWVQAAGERAAPSKRLRRRQRDAMAVTDFKLAGSTTAALVAVHGLASAWRGDAGRQPCGNARGPDASRRVCASASQPFRISDGATVAAASGRASRVTPARIPPAAA